MLVPNPPFDCLFVQLQWAPDGFHSVCGTENHQQVLPVRLYAAKGDRMAEMLLRKGDVFGKQYVTFQSHQAYPAYVVTYNCPNYLPPNVFISSSPSRTQVVVVVVAVVVVGHAFTAVSRSPIPAAEAYEMGAQGEP